MIVVFLWCHAQENINTNGYGLNLAPKNIMEDTREIEKYIMQGLLNSDQSVFIFSMTEDLAI